MAAVTVPALVLQAFPYGETSRILRLLTPELGVQSAIAKGATRPKSRFGGLLEPFVEGAATLHLKEGRELQTLAGFDLTRTRRGLGADLVRFGGASLLTEITLRTGSEEPHPGLFTTVGAALDHLETAEEGALEAAVLTRAWQLVGLLGFGPALDFCLDCGRPLGADEPAWLDYGAGGVRCAACAAGRPGTPLPPHARAAMAAMVEGHTVPLPRTAGHWVVLERFLQHHVLEGATLRSLAFLTGVLPR